MSIYTGRQAARLAEFRDVTKGVRAWTVARALNTLTSGVDWRGCTKSDLAEAYATSEHRLSNFDVGDVSAAVARVTRPTPDGPDEWAVRKITSLDVSTIQPGTLLSNGDRRLLVDEVEFKGSPVFLAATVKAFTKRGSLRRTTHHIKYGDEWAITQLEF